MRDISKSFLSVGELNADVGEVEVAYAKLRGLQDGKAITGITITSATLNNNDKNNQSELPSATTTSPWLGPLSLPVVKDDTRDQEDTRGSKLSAFNDTNEVREMTTNYGSFIQNDTGTYTMSVNDTGAYSSEGSGTIDYLANMIFGDGDEKLRDDEGNIVERPPLNNIRGILGKLRVNDDNNSSVVIKDDMSIHALFNKADEVLATTPEVDHLSVSEENTREGVPQQVICTKKKNDDEEEGGDIASLLKSSMSFVSQIGQEVELAKGHKMKATSEDKTVSNDNKKKKSSKKMTIQLEGRSRSKNTSPVLSKSPKPVTTPKMKASDETPSNHITESSTMKSGETKKVENTKRMTIKSILHSPRYNGKKLMGSLSPNRSKNKRAAFKFDKTSSSPEVNNVDTATDPVKADTTDITPAPDASPEASPNTTQPESTQKERTSSPAEESEAPTLMSWKDLKNSNKAAEEGTLPTTVDDNITKDTKIDALSVVTEYDDTKKKIDDSTVESEGKKATTTEVASQNYAMECSPVMELSAAAVSREACSLMARNPKDNRNVLELLADATYEIVKVCCNDTIGASFDEDTTSHWISGNETMSTREHSSHVRKWRNYKRRSTEAVETDMSSVSRDRGLTLANSGLETNAKSMKTEKASNTRVSGSPVPFIVMPSSEQKEKKKTGNGNAHTPTMEEQSQVLSVKSIKSPKRLSARLRSLPTKFSAAHTLVGSRSTIKKKKDNDDFVMEDAFMEDIMKMVQLEAMNTVTKGGENLPQGITELIEEAIVEGIEGEKYVV